MKCGKSEIYNLKTGKCVNKQDLSFKTLRQRILDGKNGNIYIRTVKKAKSLRSAEWKILPTDGKLKQRGSRKAFASQKNIAFYNPSGDTLLVAPLPSRKNYANIYRFTKNSTKEEWNKFFGSVERAIKKWKKDKGSYPIVYTHGFGVPWLHVRLEKIPKYLK